MEARALILILAIESTWLLARSFLVIFDAWLREWLGYSFVDCGYGSDLAFRSRISAVATA